MLKKRLKSIGPGLWVTASFVGPGTVTTASIAGAGYGFALMWAVVFSIVTTIILQEMAARLGVVSREGLGDALRTTFSNPLLKVIVIVLVVSALGFGSAVYARGDVIGASLGLEGLTGVPARIWAPLSGIVVLILLFIGRYKVIERALMVLVGTMGLVFLVTAVMERPDLGAMLKGMFVPGIPAGATLTIIGLIGTTVVPYNMFLHSSSVQAKWPESVPTEEALSESRTDTVLSVSLGGLITLAIVATAAAAFFGRGIEIEDAVTMAQQLEPLLGPAAKYFFALGLFAAGLTSMIAGALAAAYAVSTTLGWGSNLKGWGFRFVWAAVLLFGIVSAVLGSDPVAAIVFAQAANGILLPLIAVFLLVVMNRRDLLGDKRNGIAGNVIGSVVVLVVTGLGAYSLLSAFGVFG